jgi:hypothetical protein
VKFGVGPDGGDAVVIGEVSGFDAERGRADDGDDGGDEAEGHQEADADFGLEGYFYFPEDGDGKEGADEVCYDGVGWLEIST